MDTTPAFISKQITKGDYYFLNLQPGQDFTVVCGGYEQCSLDYQYRRNEANYLSIEYIIAGRALLELEGKRYELQPGSLFGYRHDTLWTMTSVGKTPLRKYFMALGGGSAQQLLDASPLQSQAPVDFPGVQWIEETFRQITKFGATEDQLAVDTCSRLAEVLLLQLDPEFRKSINSTLSIAHSTYLRCRKYLRDHFLELNSANELADAANVDPTYLSRLFRQFDKEPPYKCLVRLKMNHAARILISQDVTIKEISDLIGYPDQLHFSRTFKRTYGVSPKYFKKSVNRN
ncbi:helix-turn-helix transcriptional regulator [Pelagicoccus sp. NFK12]|uniref:Helix-turn-helix transcriptional regulator n=1 Tax=Pelagicoccus enzymogenes TaxID=2773457 RepID=A0A927IG60_9BACT|nr:AraC family transcriptional regulator [Pelagicoccus enzymogenes]MBD5778035.1 helix-turn-helix transcriptional regulator [Pelagicoccus enzymogenes]